MEFARKDKTEFARKRNCKEMKFAGKWNLQKSEFARKPFCNLQVKVTFSHTVKVR